MQRGLSPAFGCLVAIDWVVAGLVMDHLQTSLEHSQRQDLYGIRLVATDLLATGLVVELIRPPTSQLIALSSPVEKQLAC